MLKDLEEGKYDAVIAWHPDRLARNMKASVVIIDMLDKGHIQNLGFVGSHFENTPTGKMMLGINFVISKQYSDNLSRNVRRGMQNSTKEGKCMRSNVHGYRKDSQHRLYPDGENFVIMKQVWQKRLNGESQKSITTWLNNSGYKNRGKLVNITKQRMSALLRDPIYAGVMKYGDDIVNLNDHYNFTPMVTVEEFLMINKIDTIQNAFIQTPSPTKRESKQANLLNGMIFCSQCDSVMHSTITTKKTQKRTKDDKPVVNHYYYYRCSNRSCTSKYVRAKVIIHWVVDFLTHNSLATKKSYNSYKREIKRLAKDKHSELVTQKQHLQRRIGVLRKELEANKKYHNETTDDELKDIYAADLKLSKTKLDTAQDELETCTNQITEILKAPLTCTDFVELFQQLPDRIQKAKSMDELDTMIKFIFSNFVVNHKEVTNHKLQAPFDVLLKPQKTPKKGQNPLWSG